MCAESESLLSSEVMKRRSVRPIREREREERERREREGRAVKPSRVTLRSIPGQEKKFLLSSKLWRGELIGVFLCCSESHSGCALGHLSADTFPPEARTPPRVCVHRTWISSFVGLR